MARRLRHLDLRAPAATAAAATARWRFLDPLTNPRGKLLSRPQGKARECAEHTPHSRAPLAMQSSEHAGVLSQQPLNLLFPRSLLPLALLPACEALRRAHDLNARFKGARFKGPVTRNRVFCCRWIKKWAGTRSGLGQEKRS